MKKPINILVVEDNILNFKTFELLLNLCKIEIASVTNTVTLSETIDFLSSSKPDIIFLDLDLPDCKALESFKPLEKLTVQIPIVVLSANSNIETSIEALSLGAQDYLIKGNFDIKILDKTILYSIERKKAKILALSLEEKYRQIFYENSIPMLIVDNTTHKVLECNDASLIEYGYSREEFLQLGMDDIWLTKDLEKIISSLKSGYSSKHKKLLKHKKKSGEIIFVNVTICDVKYNNKLVRQIQVQNITPQILLEQALKREQQEKELKIRKIANIAQEEERYNIGIELHENINQILAASLLYLDNFVKSDKLKLEMATKCKEHIATAMKEVKALSNNLIPPTYIDEDFIDSLNEIFIPIRHLHAIQIEINLNKSLNKLLSKQQKLAIFRIIQEQLNNIVKHSEASKVTISAEIIANQLTLSIADNGIGCITKNQKKGLGLQSIISRAELFNGSAKFISNPNKGFEVLVSFKIL